jgi:hypothetical protein
MNIAINSIPTRVFRAELKLLKPSIYQVMRFMRRFIQHNRDEQLPNDIDVKKIIVISPLNPRKSSNYFTVTIWLAQSKSHNPLIINIFIINGPIYAG